MNAFGKFIILAALTFLTLPAAAADWALVHAGRVLAVPGEDVMREATIVIKDGVVHHVESGFTSPENIGIEPGENVRVYDLKTQFVLPGLIDSHVHLEFQMGPGAKLNKLTLSDGATALRAAKYARTTLLAGFTTVRDLGGSQAIFDLRNAINAGHVAGPRIFAAGEKISPTGGHGDFHGYREEVLDLFPKEHVCDGVEDCRRAVRALVKMGADQIKITVTGGITSEANTGTGQQFFDDELVSIIATARMLGRKVTAHAHSEEGVNAALRAGVSSVEHATYASDDSFKLFKKNDVFLVPTLLAGATVAELANNPESYLSDVVRKKVGVIPDQMVLMTGKAHRAGVKIAFGTDSGVSAHGDNAREFGLLLKAGLTPVEAIVAATINSAKNLGKSDIIGTLEPDKYADLIAVEGDPLSDLSVLSKPTFVMKAGQVY